MVFKIPFFQSFFFQAFFFYHKHRSCDFELCHVSVHACNDLYHIWKENFPCDESFEQEISKKQNMIKWRELTIGVI